MAGRFLKIGLIVGILLASFSVNAGLLDPKLKWRTADTKHFSIHYYEGEEKIIERLAVISEEVYESLSKKWDARPWGKTEVVVVDLHDSANGFTTVIPYNLIILRVVAPPPENTLADYDDWIRELFAHEYTHVLHISDTGYPAKFLKFLVGKLMAPNGLSPGWVVEGIATYFESEETGRGRRRSSFKEMLLRTDILRGQFLKLDQMAGTRYDWPSWLAQYFYGVGFWEFLSDKYGEEKIYEFSHRYGSSLWFFSLNNKAKKVFGKSFYKLWGEWKEELETRYARVKRDREAAGLREGSEWAGLETHRTGRKKESHTLPAFTPDGKALLYSASSVHHRSELRRRDLESGEEKILLKGRDLSQIAISPDGKKLVFSSIGRTKKYYMYWDLHELDLETDKVKQITRGERARDPDFSPDGKSLITVRQKLGHSVLAVYDLTERKEKKEGEDRFREIDFLKEGAEFNHPRWSPKGGWVAVSVHHKGQRDLWLVDPLGRRAPRRVTNDVAIEDRPVWDPNGRFLYYSSDADGISNIYRYDLESGRRSRVTNVLTGAFAPTVSPSGEIAFQYYNGKGFEIHRLGQRNTPRLPAGTLAEPASLAVTPARALPLGRRSLHNMEATASERFRSNSSGEAGGVPAFSSQKYNPFRRLFVPRFILPNVVLIDGAVFMSATTGNADPLNWHQWSVGGTYRTDNNFFGYGVGYSYSRYAIAPFAGVADFTVNYGDIFGLGADFFEERKRAVGGFFMPFSPIQGITLSYFFENRSEEAGLPPGATLSTLGNYAGISGQYKIGRQSETAAAISPESGGSFMTAFELTDGALGAAENLEQQVVSADSRLYIRMPYSDHQVLALRGAGGVAFGDRLLQGNFGLGGSLGEIALSATSTRLFTLRGLPIVTFSRDRAWVASAEYRFPLFRLQRGPGTLPVSLNSAHFSLFADVGDAFNKGQRRFRPLLGVGGEFRGDFVIGYNVPVMGRLGYGIILTHRERITGLKDDITGADVRNGVLILELGTSF